MTRARARRHIRKGSGVSVEHELPELNCVPIFTGSDFDRFH